MKLPLNPLTKVILLAVAWLLIRFVCDVRLFGESFLAEDFAVLEALRVKGPFGVWTTSPSTFFRPATTVVLWAIQRGTGGSAAAFQIFADLLIVATATMLFDLIRRLTNCSLWISAGAATLFVIWPGHTEARYWMVASCDLLATFWTVAAISCLDRAVMDNRKGWLATVSAFFLALAVLSKESAAIAPVALGILAMWRMKSRTKSVAVFVATSVIVLAIFFVRAKMIGSMLGGYGSVHASFRIALFDQYALPKLSHAWFPAMGYFADPVLAEQLAFWGISALGFFAGLCAPSRRPTTRGFAIGAYGLAVLTGTSIVTARMYPYFGSLTLIVSGLLLAFAIYVGVRIKHRFAGFDPGFSGVLFAVSLIFFVSTFRNPVMVIVSPDTWVTWYRGGGLGKSFATWNETIDSISKLAILVPFLAGLIVARQDYKFIRARTWLPSIAWVCAFVALVPSFSLPSFASGESNRFAVLASSFAILGIGGLAHAYRPTISDKRKPLALALSAAALCVFGIWSGMHDSRDWHRAKAASYRLDQLVNRHKGGTVFVVSAPDRIGVAYAFRNGIESIGRYRGGNTHVELMLKSSNESGRTTPILARAGTAWTLKADPFPTQQFSLPDRPSSKLRQTENPYTFELLDFSPSRDQVVTFVGENPVVVEPKY